MIQHDIRCGSFDNVVGRDDGMVEAGGKNIWVLPKVSVRTHSEGSVGAFDRAHSTSLANLGLE